MIERAATNQLFTLAGQFKSLAIVGPRQSGKTITTDYFKGIRFWNKLSGNEGGSIIYAGNESQKRSGEIVIMPWNKIDFDF